MSDDLTIAYQLGVEDMRSKLHKQADEIERLRERLAEADEANRRVSDENEKLREALKPFAAYAKQTPIIYEHHGIRMVLVQQDLLKRLCQDAAAAIRESGE